MEGSELYGCSVFFDFFLVYSVFLYKIIELLYNPQLKTNTLQILFKI